MSRIQIASFNAENFYLLLDGIGTRKQLEALSEDEYQAMNSSIYNRNKDRRKIERIAQWIRKRKFDVVGLIEVGGLETLEAFNRLYLKNRYSCFLHEDNSKRGIYVGALVRKRRFSRVEASSLPGTFSRNLLKLRLVKNSREIELYVVHLKSQFGSSLGLEQRVQEIESLTRSIPRKRCVVMGDFNGIAIRGAHQFEFSPFLELGFVDVLEARNVPIESRRTHYHFGKEPHFTQLDYIFCSPDLKIRDGATIEAEIPINRSQREFLASDHLPIWAQIQF